MTKMIVAVFYWNTVYIRIDRLTDWLIDWFCWREKGSILFIGGITLTLHDFDFIAIIIMFCRLISIMRKTFCQLSEWNDVNVVYDEQWFSVIRIFTNCHILRMLQILKTVYCDKLINMYPQSFAYTVLWTYSKSAKKICITCCLIVI